MKEDTEKPKISETKVFLKDKEASEIYGIATQTLRNWRHEGKGPHYVKIGSSILYDRKSLDEFWNRHVVIPKQQQDIQS